MLKFFVHRWRYFFQSKGLLLNTMKTFDSPLYILHFDKSIDFFDILKNVSDILFLITTQLFFLLNSFEKYKVLFSDFHQHLKDFNPMKFY